jgi:hypothetical protein
MYSNSYTGIEVAEVSTCGILERKDNDTFVMKFAAKK